METVVIDCPDCETKSRTDVLAEKQYYTEEGYESHVVFFLECPGCLRTIVAQADSVQVDLNQWGIDNLTRLWPNPNTILDTSIPRSVRRSINEARLCLQVKAYSACAVMCGKALEALCKAHNAKKWQLAQGLKELKDNEIIDGRLYEWGDSLRERRNIGAHATDDEISYEDALDVLDFTIAICEYVYVLSEKYEKFKAREAKRKNKKST